LRAKKKKRKFSPHLPVQCRGKFIFVEEHLLPAVAVVEPGS
jgi:hypothetical protein